MQQFMRHPEHGATHAYSYGEIEELRKRGWEIADEPVGKATEDGVAVAGGGADGAEGEAAAPQEPKRRGRPAKKAAE